MLRFTHIFIIHCLYVVFNFYVSNTVVTPPPPFLLILNLIRANNLWYEQDHLERKYPSFAPLDSVKISLISFLFILSLPMLLLHLCNSVRYVTLTTNSVRYVTLTTNLTLNRGENVISRLRQSYFEAIIRNIKPFIFN